MNVNNNKRNHYKRHAKARATQRLGINLHKNLHDQIVKDIQENKYKLLYRSSEERNVYEYDEEYSVVYDRRKKCLVTFIPKEKSIIVPSSKESLLPESVNPSSLNQGSVNQGSVNQGSVNPSSQVSFSIRRILNGD